MLTNILKLLSVGVFAVSIAACSSAPSTPTDWSNMSEHEIAAWKNEGISAANAQLFKKAGISVDEAAGYSALGLSFSDANKWFSKSFNAEETKGWLDAGYNLEDAEKMRNKGLTPVVPTE